MKNKFDPNNWKSSLSNKQHSENYLRAVNFQSPEWIPNSISIFPAVWKKYRKDLHNLVIKYPFVFGGWMKKKKNFDKIPSGHQLNNKFVDNWGCEWLNRKEGIEGQVIKNPLSNWNNFKNYTMPDPLTHSDTGKHSRLHWYGTEKLTKLGKRMNVLSYGPGGRLFDRLYFLRGFDNLMSDFARKSPNLQLLIDAFQANKMRLLDKVIPMNFDIIGFHTDIGTQDRLMISPRQFRKYIKPMFSALFKPIRAQNTHVYLSSDGYLLDIVDDLVDVGVSVHDPQLRANGLEGIKQNYKGKMCIDLDLDRQMFPFAGPDEIKESIYKSVEMLNSPEGGFMMKAEISDVNISLENIEAIAIAFEETCILKHQ